MKLSGQVTCPQTNNPVGSRVVISYCPKGKSQPVDTSFVIAKENGEWDIDLNIDSVNTRIKVTYYPPAGDIDHAALEWDGVVTCDQGVCVLRPASLPPRIKTAVRFPVREAFWRCVAEISPGREKWIPRALVSRDRGEPAYVGWVLAGRLESKPVTVVFPDGTEQQGQLQAVKDNPGFYQFAK